MRCSATHQRYDGYDVRADLRAGENVLAVLVHVYGTDTAWYEQVRGLWRENFGDGALWCQGFARCGTARLPLDRTIPSIRYVKLAGSAACRFVEMS